jgi:hypothetical protein
MDVKEIAAGLKAILEDEYRQRLLLPYSSDPQLPSVEPWFVFNESGIYIGRQVASELGGE